MIYDEEARQRVRASLTNEQHAYVTTLENIARKAYHAWKNTPHANKPSRLAAECLNDLYDALAKVDFMEGDKLRDANE